MLMGFWQSPANCLQRREDFFVRIFPTANLQTTTPVSFGEYVNYKDKKRLEFEGNPKVWRKFN